MAIHIAWDNSNIWLVGREVCKTKEPGDEGAFRIHFANMLDFVRDSRQVADAVVGGSVPPPNDSLWSRFEDLGIQPQKQERGQSTGREVAVDEVIQLQMANWVLAEPSPGTMVLLTGDGSGYDDGRGFLKQLELAHKHGWGVEVVSWDRGCNRLLRDFAQRSGVYRPLEPEYHRVTFINNGRFTPETQPNYAATGNVGRTGGRPVR